MNGQHKRILFMISLPQTAEFETCNENVSECINKLREKRVDVCESIHREDLATLNQYDIVIIVAHHDTDDDALLLADGKLSMDDFVNSIPEDFCGELDFSSCYSASVMKAIKDRCSNCHIQASIHQTTLALRLLAYPYVIDIINEDKNIEYHDAYMKVLDMMLEAASESSESEEEQPELVKLGNQLSSVYAPSEVKRASRFMIQIILHYDSESGTILAIAKGHEPDTIWRGKLLENLCEGDKFSIKIRFDSENISVVDDENAKHNEYVKQIIVSNEVVEEQFMVEVASEFSGSSFWTIIDLLKDNNWVPSFKFKIIVSDNENKVPADIVMEIPQKNEDLGSIYKRYLKNFTPEIFKENHGKFQHNIAKGDDEEASLFFIRKFLYNNDLFTRHLNDVIDEYEKKMLTLGSLTLISSLNKYISTQREKLEILDEEIRTLKRENVRYEDASQKFLALEDLFNDLCSCIARLYYQVELLDRFEKIRERYKKRTCIGISNDADWFWEIPHLYSVDREILEIFRKEGGTSSIIHSKSKGVTMPFLALLLAMLCGEYKSVDKGGEDWTINVGKYIDFRKDKDKYEYKTLRTAKNRINKLVGLLDRDDIREIIKKYQETEEGKISVLAYYLLKVKVSII